MTDRPAARSEDDDDAPVQAAALVPAVMAALKRLPPERLTDAGRALLEAYEAGASIIVKRRVEQSPRAAAHGDVVARIEAQMPTVVATRRSVANSPESNRATREARRLLERLERYEARQKG